jgi:Lon protease-like protein
MARELAIFPLPLVLFPGATQPLHIFEPRYRQLLADCVDGDRRFGIVYAAPDPARPDWDPEPAPGAVGCTARIRLTQQLPDGRSNILTDGERRFVVLAWLPTDRPYRMARVEEFDDEPADPAELSPLAGDVRERFARLAEALGTPVAERAEFPADVERLSFIVAAALELDRDTRLALLALRDTPTRLRRLAGLLRSLAADAEQHAAARERARGNGKERAPP